MKKSTRRGCPLAGSCRPIYHPPSLEKANRAYARWGRAMRRARWARRGARALAPAGAVLAALALLCGLGRACGWLPAVTALSGGGILVLAACGCLALSLLLREVARAAQETGDAAYAAYENACFAATSPRSAHFMGGCRGGK